MKIKIENKYFKSLKFRVLLLVLLIGMVPVFLIRIFLTDVYENKLVEQKTERIKTQCTILRNHLTSEDYVNLQKSDIVDTELTQMSVMFNARIMIINNSFKIINDTYVMDKGKYCVTQTVIKSMTGNETVSSYNGDEAYIEVVIRIPAVNGDSHYNGILYAVFSTEDIDETMAEVNRSAWIWQLVLYTIIVALAIFYSFNIAKPFKKIETSLEGIKDGYFTENMKIEGYTETEQISNSFNHMIERLKNLDQSRQEFVSNVSHELKTPITSIKVLADSLLTQEYVPNEMYKEFLTDIVDEIDRENKIITDLLALVKMDKSNAELIVEKVNINEMIELILKRLRPIAAKRNIELVFESFRPVIAEVDEVKLTIAISNLVENAIKYNVLDGWVRVSLNADHKFFYVKVADSGIGIPDEAKEHVYERFYRVDKTRTRETGGTGLGLSITQNAVAMHKGIVRLYSKEGEGTTFNVRIPLNYIP